MGQVKKMDNQPQSDAELVTRGVNPETAKNMAGSNQGPWHLSLSQAMSVELPNAELASLGLPSLTFLAKA